MIYTITTKKTEIKHFAVTTAAEIELLSGLGYRIEDVIAKGKGDFVRLCEVCGLPIFHDDEHHQDTEGVYWHEECPEVDNA